MALPRELAFPRGNDFLKKPARKNFFFRAGTRLQATFLHLGYFIEFLVAMISSNNKMRTTVSWGI